MELHLTRLAFMLVASIKSSIKLYKTELGQKKQIVFLLYSQEKSLPGVVMALVCNVFDMLYQLANLEEPR